MNKGNIKLLNLTDKNRKRIYLSVLFVCCAAISIPLIIHIYVGSFMRYSGDDYCYAATQVKYGFWGTQWYAYQHIGQLYNGNRYSLNLALAVMDLFPPKAFGLTTGIGIVFLLASIVFCLYRIGRRYNNHLHFLEYLFLALCVLFFMFYVTGDVTQILYWYTGFSTYALPLGFNILLLGLILWAPDSRKPSAYIPAIIFISLIAGGFSETTALMQVCWIALVILAAVVKRGDINSRSLLIPAIIAIIATFGSIILLAISPAIDVRLGLGKHPAPVELLKLTIKYVIDFFYTNIKSTPIPYFVVLILGIFFSYFQKISFDLPAENIRNLKHVGWITIVCFLIVAASFSPSIYAQYAYPGERAQLPARFITVVSLLAVGYNLGRLVPYQKLILKANTLMIVYICSLLFSLALGAYMIKATIPISSQIPKFQKWASFWDLRDQKIREDRQNGILNVQVILIDHVISDVVDLTPNPLDGYNRCAATYYGVDTITANLAGWDN